MKSMVSEYGLAVIAAIVALFIIVSISTQYFVPNELGEAVGNAVAQQNSGEYTPVGIYVEFINRPAPVLSLANNNEAVTMGMEINLQDYVDAHDGNGKDISEDIVFSINGERVYAVYQPSKPGKYCIDACVEDDEHHISRIRFYITVEEMQNEDGV